MSYLKRLVQLWNPERNREFGPPIFIFAASWRTGSTLLQRIINGSGDVFVWGEPAFLPEARSLFERTEAYLEKVKGNKKAALKNTVGSWIPVVSPAPERAKEASRAFFDVLYRRETEQLGLCRWGFKEVRADAVAHMRFLSNLWPEARFLFLVRNPYDMYRSIKGKKFHANFRDPFQPVQVWHDNVSEYLSDHELGNRCLMLTYEELAKQSRQCNKLLHNIACHLGISVTERMYNELKARTDPSGGNIVLTEDERMEITQIVGDSYERIGYLN